MNMEVFTLDKKKILLFVPVDTFLASKIMLFLLTDYSFLVFITGVM